MDFFEHTSIEGNLFACNTYCIFHFFLKHQASVNLFDCWVVRIHHFETGSDISFWNRHLNSCSLQKAECARFVAKLNGRNRNKCVMHNPRRIRALRLERNTKSWNLGQKEKSENTQDGAAPKAQNTRRVILCCLELFWLIRKFLHFIALLWKNFFLRAWVLSVRSQSPGGNSVAKKWYNQKGCAVCHKNNATERCGNEV